MAKKKKPASLARLYGKRANWYFKLSAADKAKQLEYITRTTRELRKYFTGFDGKAGYDLRFTRGWNAKRVAEVQKYGSYLHNLLSTPYVRAVPRGRKAKRGLAKFTGQNLPRQKAFVVHTEHPDTTKVTVPDGKVTVTREVKDATLREAYFLFEEMIGRQPVTFTQMRRALKRMLPKMPEGFYQLWTVPHGEIGVPVEKKMIHRFLQEYENRYESAAAARFHKDFPEAILGFKWQAATFDEAAEIYNARQADRQRRRRQAEMARRARRGSLRARVRGRL